MYDIERHPMTMYSFQHTEKHLPGPRIQVLSLSLYMGETIFRLDGLWKLTGCRMCLKLRELVQPLPLLEISF